MIFIYLPFKMVKKKEKTKIVRLNLKELKYILLFVTIIALLIEGYYIFELMGLQFLLSTSKQTISLINRDLPFIFSGVRQLLYLLVPMLYLYSQRIKDKFIKYFSFIIALFNISIALILIDRSNLLFATMPILFLIFKFQKINKLILLFLIIVAGIVLIDFKDLMNSIIYSIEVEFNIIRIPEEFFASYNITSDIIKKIDTNLIDFSIGKSYIESFIGIILPFREVEPLSVWYSKTFYTDTFLRGGGLAFSSVAESYLNFGFLGIPIYFSILGFFASFFKKNYNNNDLYLLIYSLLIPLVYKFFRAEFYSLTKTTVWFWLIPLIIVFLINNIKSIINKM